MKSDYKLKVAVNVYLKFYVIMKNNQKELMEIMNKYAYVDWRKADTPNLLEADKTPQFEQDAENCWLYSMFNNAYYNFEWDFRLNDVIEVKKLMESYWLNIKDWAGAPLSGAFIAKYLTEKWNLPIRSFQIDFFAYTLNMSELLKKWMALEMSRINTPLLYTDAFDDGKVNQIYHKFDAEWWHSVNIVFDADMKMIKELWTRGNNNKKNQFYYDILQFGNNIKTRAISPLFNFLWILKDE